jgi:CheY-like chemotaxis protein
LKVLLVDDDELIQESFSAILEVLGHSITPALSSDFRGRLRPNMTA